MTVLAKRLGVGRATIYRWFGSRDALLGEVLARELEQLVAAHRRRVRRRGAAGLLEVFDSTNRSLSKAPSLRRLLEQERERALRLLTSSGGPVQPRAVACIESLIQAEISAGTYEPTVEPETLAYAIVRLAEAFLYNDAVFGVRGEYERLRRVDAALLGIDHAAGAGAKGRVNP